MNNKWFVLKQHQHLLASSLKSNFSKSESSDYDESSIKNRAHLLNGIYKQQLQNYNPSTSQMHRTEHGPKHNFAAARAASFTPRMGCGA
jgi:hypothetical protein